MRTIVFLPHECICSELVLVGAFMNERSFSNKQPKMKKQKRGST